MIIAIIITKIIIILLSPLLSDIYYYSCPKSMKHINNINFRTGDLLLCRWNDYNVLKPNNNKLQFIPSNLFIPNPFKIFSSLCGYYSHISIIIIINDIPYIYDITLHDTSNNNSKLKYDMWTKKYVINKPTLLNIDYIKQYHGDIYHVQYIGNKIYKSVIKNILNKYRKHTFNISNSIIGKLSLGLYQGDNTRKVSCSSLISNVLYDMGINFTSTKNPTVQDVYNNCINKKTHLNEPNLITF